MTHGTRAAYQAGCPCTPCRSANAAYLSEQRARIRAGSPGLIDAGAARAHCFKLRAMNIGYRQIAKLADVDPGTVQELCSGAHPMMRREIADKIMAVPFKPAMGALVIAHDTWRMIRLLRKEQYSNADLAKRMGLHDALRIGRTWCRVKTAALVRREYRRARPESTQTDDE